jgi:hypothetical protein
MRRLSEPTAREVRNPEQFLWLARYQVAGESFAVIWRNIPRGDNRTRSAFEKACKRLAKDIDLTLRPS